MKSLHNGCTIIFCKLSPIIDLHKRQDEMMIVGLDIRKIEHLGIGTYIVNLLRHFEHAPGDIQFVVFGHPEVRSQFSLSERFTVISNTTKQFSLGGMISLGRQVQTGHIDIFHTPHYILPFDLKVRSVVTIHDVIPLLFPEYFGIHKRLYAWTMMHRSCSKADRILTVSKTSARDIKEKFRITDERLKVIHVGVNELFHPLTEKEKILVRQRYSLNESYLLYSGALKPHKNVPRLLSALSKIPESRRPQLVLIGEDLTGAEQVKTALVSYQLSSSVRILGKLPAEEVIGIYGAAHALIHPSLYEGFGSIVIEAMAAGIPVASSSAGSLTEIIGDAAIFFNPIDEEEIVEAIEKIMQDTLLREELVRRGNERIKCYSWKRCAEATLQVYREIM
jgi:glycosyltransferase involved in cell wall biosynthesis